MSRKTSAGKVSGNWLAFCGLLMIGWLVFLSACAGADGRSSQLQNQERIPPEDKIRTSDLQVIRYAIFPAPPYMIGARANDTEISGIDVEIVQEIARWLGMEIDYVCCTWERCLELMKAGEVDLLSSAYKKPDREAYMLYLDQPFLDQLPIAFYFLKENNYVVEEYEDIYQFNQIGVLLGASYFDRFDQDHIPNKYEVSSQDQLFPMLLAGRLDAIAGYVPTENYRIVVEEYGDRIERSAYEYQETAFVYMAISKKSPLVARFSEINQINDALIAEGFVDQIVNAYYEKYR